MANEIFTRIQLKYDSYTEWQKVEATFKPLKGEICIVNPATNLADAAKVPCLMKVGDGTNFFKDLPWISATAADVYKWAKAADVDFEKFNYELYYENLVFYVNELVPGVRHVFTDSTAKFADGKYTISLKYGTELIENTKCLSLMERIALSQLGCNMEFEFVDDRNEEEITIKIIYTK